MSQAKLDAVPSVDIDEEGVFKYILIKVKPSNAEGPSKMIVRGYIRAHWHSDIFDEVSTSLQGLGLTAECVGGGRIEHRPSEKKLKVYGYSQGYGKADHDTTRSILQSKYSGYVIGISDDGY
uniref:Sex-regulated protein janus-A n=1 Tax=Tabanus bromius TaxID=304241 RepID=A0A0K8TQA2_TABBR